MAIVLGLLVAVSYGSADFYGALASKRATVAAVTLLSQVIGLGFVSLLLIAVPGVFTARALGLGAVAGLFGCIGLTLLYRGLASGRMSVVAPITAVGAAVLPAVYGLATGERPSAAALAGIIVAVIAIAFVSRAVDDGEADGQPLTAVIVASLIAGAAFGVIFILFGSTPTGSGFWPLAAGRLTSVAVLGTIAAVRRRPVHVPPNARFLLLVTGVFDIGANALYLLAARRGLLSLVAVLSSLYPAPTVVLARVVLHERIARVQFAGIALALIGVVLIAAG